MISKAILNAEKILSCPKKKTNMSIFKLSLPK